ncbi:MAG: hypothetical protein ABH881_02635 [bacterium]
MRENSLDLIITLREKISILLFMESDFRAKSVDGAIDRYINLFSNPDAQGIRDLYKHIMCQAYYIVLTMFYMDSPDGDDLRREIRHILDLISAAKIKSDVVMELSPSLVVYDYLRYTLFA